MIKAELITRIECLTQAIGQSIANHNALLGRLEEAKFTLEMIEKNELASSEPADH